MLKALAVGIALFLPCLSFASPVLKAEGEEAKKETRPVIDETQVYFGRAKCCKAPAVVDAARVYRAIPEYKKILDNKLTEKDAEYSLLLVKATKKFRAAVEGAAADNACDLVANLGAVTWDGHTVPDLTDATLKKVEEQSKTNS
jgi:hypothetical protein